LLRTYLVLHTRG